MSAIDRQAAHRKSRDSRKKLAEALEIGVGETGTNDKPLGLGGLTMVIYFGVCGGAVYAEELVGSQGPLIGIIAMIAYPLIVGLPQCLVTAEYATAFKGNGGFLSWINCAYGGKATQMVAFMNYLCMTADTSLYPPMALDYAAATWPALQPLSDNPFALSSYLFKASFATIFFVLLLTGLQPIGKGLQVLILIVMIPQTLLIFLFGFGKMDFSLLGGTKYTPYLNETSNEMITDSSRGTDFFYFLNVLVWNYSAFDQSSLVSSEVKDPKKTYPRASKIGLGLIMVTYFLPLFVAGGLFPDWSVLGEGSLPLIGEKAGGGEWLKVTVSFAAMGSATGLYLVTMYECFHLALDCVHQNIIKERVWGINLTRRSPQGVPIAGAALTFCLVLLYQCFDIETILVFTNTAGTVCTLIEWAACIKLRWHHKNVQGEYTVPIKSDWGFFVLLTPTQAIGVFYICYAIYEQFADPEGSIAEIGLGLFIVASVQILLPVLVGIAWTIHYSINGKTKSIDMDSEQRDLLDAKPRHSRGASFVGLS